MRKRLFHQDYRISRIKIISSFLLIFLLGGYPICSGESKKGAGSAKGKQATLLIENLANARNICEHLETHLSDKKYLKKLQGTFEGIEDKNIKISAGCVLVMGHFYIGNDSTARKLRKSLEKQFSRHSYFRLIQPKNLSIVCNKCGGDGKLSIKCPRCLGTGICRICKGRGYIKSRYTNDERKCPDCNGTAVCRKCKGTGLSTEICRKCYGKGSVISKVRIKQVYVEFLAESVEQLFTAEQVAKGLVKFEGEWVTPEKKAAIEEKRSRERAAEQAQRAIEKNFFAEAIRKASGELDLNIAISMMEAAIGVYSNSPCAGTAREYLNELFVAKEEVLKKAREKKRREEALVSVDQIPKVINGLLQAQKRDEYGLEYWEDPHNATKLFAIVEWEIVNQEVNGATALVKVRIESSTKGGLPIRKIWKFYMSYTGSWKVSLLSE